MSMDDLPRVEVRSAAELDDWLAANHGRDEGVWLVTWKASCRDRYVSRDAVLDALLAWGWIDGRRKVLDESRTMQLIAPRRQQAWAQSYKDRVARLEGEGRMRPPGLARVAEGRASGLWDFYADVDRLEVPGDLAEALEARPGARAGYEAAPPAYRRNLLRWVKLARTEATRQARIAKIVASAAEGTRIPQM